MVACAIITIIENNYYYIVQKERSGEKMSMDWNKPEADQYEHTIALKIPGYHLLYEMTERLLASALGARSADASLLAIGAGGGQELTALGRAYPGRKFTAVDPSARMLNMAKRRVEREGVHADIEWVEGEVQELPAESRFDGATCMLALHFVKGRQAKLGLLKAAAERLHDGAPLFLACINGDLAAASTRLQLAGWRSHMLANGIAEAGWEQFAGSLGVESDVIPFEEVTELLTEAGFSGAARYFGSYLIDGMVALKQGGRESC
jgi:tRNA (cmo5U34)-methyltransferase